MQIDDTLMIQNTPNGGYHIRRAARMLSFRQAMAEIAKQEQKVLPWQIAVQMGGETQPHWRFANTVLLDASMTLDSAGQTDYPLPVHLLWSTGLGTPVEHQVIGIMEIPQTDAWNRWGVAALVLVAPADADANANALERELEHYDREDGTHIDVLSTPRTIILCASTHWQQPDMPIGYYAGSTHRLQVSQLFWELAPREVRAGIKEVLAQAVLRQATELRATYEPQQEGLSLDEPQ